MTNQQSEITSEKIRKLYKGWANSEYDLNMLQIDELFRAYLAKCEEVAEYQSFVKILADFLDYPSMTKWISDNATEGETILVGQIGAAAALLGGCKMFNPFEEDNQRLQAIIEKQREALAEISKLSEREDCTTMVILYGIDIISKEALSLTPTKTEES